MSPYVSCSQQISFQDYNVTKNKKKILQFKLHKNLHIKKEKKIHGVRGHKKILNVHVLHDRCGVITDTLYSTSVTVAPQG